MQPRIVLLSAALLGSCASPPTMAAPSDEELAACEAQGGSIEPAYAIDAYVCLLPTDSARPD